LTITNCIGQLTGRWVRFVFAVSVDANLVAVACIFTGTAVIDIILANAFTPAADLIFGFAGDARFSAASSAADLRWVAFGLAVAAMLCVILQIEAI
jgi:hypothetical protein